MAMQARFYYLQIHAHRMVIQALRHGDLIKPCTCGQCGCITEFLDAHHLDYSKPLEVIWLCRSCHLKTHGTMAVIHPKRYDASNIVKRYLAEFPDAIYRSPSELASLLSVGKSTVYNVFKELKTK